MEKELNQKSNTKGYEIDKDFEKYILNTTPFDKKNLQTSDFESLRAQYECLDEKEILSKILIEKKISNINIIRIRKNIAFFFWFVILTVLSSLLIIVLLYLKSVK